MNTLHYKALFSRLSELIFCSHPRQITSLSSSDSGSDSAVKKRLIVSATLLQALKQGTITEAKIVIEVLKLQCVFFSYFLCPCCATLIASKLQHEIILKENKKESELH